MIKGSIVAIVTPFMDSGELDLPALAGLLEWHLSEGTDAVVSVGTTGESPTLTVEEHIAVIRHTVEVVAGRMPVIAGTGANATAEAIEWTAAAREAGADACLLVAPYYNKPSQRGLYAHYKAIAEAVDIPQILYNVPGRTACDLLPETVMALSSIPNIIGIKDATGDIARGKQLIAQCGKDFAVYSGDDATAMELMLAGAAGNISVTANLLPKAMHDLCMAAIKGDRTSATVINDRLATLNKVLFVEGNPVPVKWALAQMGKIGNALRLPLVDLDPQHHETLRRAMQEAGL
jgi:4-hydroxy-tetrahydrodipicolinate synthase